MDRARSPSLQTPSPKTKRDYRIALPMKTSKKKSKRKKRKRSKKSRSSSKQTQEDLAMIDSLLHNNHLETNSMNATVGSPSSRQCSSDVLSMSMAKCDYISSDDDDENEELVNNQLLAAPLGSDASTLPDRTPNNTAKSVESFRQIDTETMADTISIINNSNENESDDDDDNDHKKKHVHTTTIDVNWDLDPIESGSIRSTEHVIQSIDPDAITSIDIIKEDDWID